MELTLNLAWAILAGLGLLYWLRIGNEERGGRSKEVVALGLLALILFPVISITDDFLAAQMLAETDANVRRHCEVHRHTVAPDIALRTHVDTALPLAFQGHIPAGEESIAAPRISARCIHFIRPPPTA